MKGVCTFTDHRMYKCRETVTQAFISVVRELSFLSWEIVTICNRQIGCKALTLSLKDGHGIPNARNDLSAWCSHEDESAPVLILSFLILMYVFVVLVPFWLSSGFWCTAPRACKFLRGIALYKSYYYYKCRNWSFTLSRPAVEHWLVDLLTNALTKQPRTPVGSFCRKRKFSTISLDMTKNGLRQWDPHRNCYKGNIGEVSGRC